GEILVHMGFLDEERLRDVLRRQGADKRRLGEILLSEGHVTREQLARALAYRMGVEYVPLGDGVDPAVSSLIDHRSAMRYEAVPVRLDPDGSLLVAMTDPSNVFAVDDLRIISGHDVRPAYSLPEEIQAALRERERLDEFVQDLVEETEPDDVAGPGDLGEAVDDAPVVRLVNSIIGRAVDEGASDIHWEPQPGEMVIRYRVDGVLRRVTSVPTRLSNGVISRLKIMADLDIAEKRIPQDGRVALTSGGRSLDLRVASLPTVHGESVVIRILDRSNVMLNLDQLGFTPRVLSRYEKCYRRPYGAILVTGPTGSGKSTTLYGTLNQINTPDRKIITVEDPVEYRLPGICQVQVNNKAGLSFSAGLRSILRNDPDVVMIGEIRDRETAQIAVESALTGHLVLATLHTNDSAGALSRLTEMGVEPFLSASAVVGVLAQRLARRLCPECRDKAAIPHVALRDFLDGAGMPPGVPDPAPIYRAVGCPACGGTGYKGRVGVYEMLSMSEPIERLTVHRASSDEIRRQARREGMLTMLQDGLLKVFRGLTTLEELARAVG
ncbi:MAG: ATPase, T2SS/T4P/T4SS family, partial [Actinomycetota bacterium]